MDDDDYVPIIIAGNKIDLEEERQVTTEEGEHFADQRGIDFIECSAKENINIDELFDTIVLNVINGNSSFPLGIDSVPERTRGCILC
ncbi:Ras family protein [Entamoeba marina]